MQKKRIYCLLTWVTMVAFIGMMVVKDYHSFWTHCSCAYSECCCHHSHDLQQTICVLDGIPLSEHGAHSHSSFVEWDTDDDNCVICHFAITKILQPKYVTCGFAATCLGAMPVQDFPNSLFTYLGHCPGRAPPYC